MRMNINILVSLLTLSAFSASADYSIDWFTVDSGGGTSSGGQFSLSGTIGQPDAGLQAGGPFVLNGGFWSSISLVQTPGAPVLSIHPLGATVRISWPAPSTGFFLEQAPSATGQWTQVQSPYSTNAVEISSTIPAAGGMQFFRLHHP
jgi:hypothetical protein